MRTAAALAALAMSLGPAVAAHADPGDPLYELVDAAAERLQTADPIAASKWLSGAPITDPARAAQVLDTVSAEAQSAGLPPDYVRTAFTDQINATEAVQYNRFSWWKLDAAAAPASAPELSTSRALIDQLNRTMVGEMAEQWPVLRSTACSEELEQAKTEVAGARGLDPLYRQALDAATGSYCG